jgi:hypothetical protein
MHQKSENYEHVIRDMCEVAGIARWEEVARTRHLAIGDQTIGLIPDFETVPSTLSVYIELGQSYPERDAGLYLRLLGSNLFRPDGLSGRFAVHPESRQIVYCITLDLPDLQGADLANLIDKQMDAAASCLVQLSVES